MDMVIIMTVNDDRDVYKMMTDHDNRDDNRDDDRDNDDDDFLTFIAANSLFDNLTLLLFSFGNIFIGGI